MTRRQSIARKCPHVPRCVLFFFYMDTLMLHHTSTLPSSRQKLRYTVLCLAMSYSITSHFCFLSTTIHFYITRFGLCRFFFCTLHFFFFYFFMFFNFSFFSIFFEHFFFFAIFHFLDFFFIFPFFFMFSIFSFFSTFCPFSSF